MLLIYLLAAVVFPAAFVLLRPRTPMSPRAMRVRVVGSVVVVWLLAILWSVRGSAAADPAPPPDPTSQPSARGVLGEPADRWETEAPAGTSLALALGWLPGLAYAGVLTAVRRALAPPPPAEVYDRPGPPYFGPG